MVVPRLLITDDDLALCRVIADLFRGHGFEISTAADGDQAIALIDSSVVHLIVVDVHMPRVGGLEVIRHAHIRNRDLPCILMSADLNETIQQEAEQMHAYRVLSKPLRASTLRETVMQGLREVYGWKVG